MAVADTPVIAIDTGNSTGNRNMYTIPFPVGCPHGGDTPSPGTNHHPPSRLIDTNPGLAANIKGWGWTLGWGWL